MKGDAAVKVKRSALVGSLALVGLLAAAPLLPARGQRSSKPSGKLRELSTNCTQATFSVGSGHDSFFACVTNHGNFDVRLPGGAIIFGVDQYAVCSAHGAKLHGFDAGGAEAGFGPAVITQPTPGTFPVTITRDTTDGVFRLTQAWGEPDAIEHDVTVTMTLTNVSLFTQSDLSLSRGADIDIGDFRDDIGARSDAAYQYDQGEVGLGLGALTFLTTHQAVHEPEADWYTSTPGEGRNGCNVVSQTGAPGALTSRVLYYFDGPMAPGASRTVKFRYYRV
jgi:hypothetical protein